MSITDLRYFSSPLAFELDLNSTILKEGMIYLQTLTSRCLARPMRHSQRINMERQIRHLPVMLCQHKEHVEIIQTSTQVMDDSELIVILNRPVVHKRRPDDDW